MDKRRIISPFAFFWSIASLVVILIIVTILTGGQFNFDIRSLAKGTPANIVVDTKIVGQLINTGFYHAFAQGGEESKDMLTPIISEIKAIKPKIIRLDHLYDFYGVVNRNGNKLEFDFSRLDQAVKPILDSGAVPMLALTYMPSAIASEGNILNIPLNWNEWSLVVQKTIEHFSGKNSDNINGVYYEVWNEPDLAQFGKWSYKGNKNYLTLYHYASDGANKAQNTNEFFLGGPVTTGFYPNWIREMANTEDRMDFISWHTYADNPKQYGQDLQKAESLFSQDEKLSKLPLVISEFGFAGARDIRYGDRYAAAHAAAVIRQAIDKPPRYLMSFQLKDGPNQESGIGWGIIGHESNGKVIKPRYHIYNYIDQMTGNRVSISGEGTWVTGFATKENNTYKLLLVNFRPDLENAQAVPISFRDLDPGKYRLQLKYFLGKEIVLNKETVEATISYQLNLPANNIVIITLDKIN